MTRNQRHRITFTHGGRCQIEQVLSRVPGESAPVPRHHSTSYLCPPADTRCDGSLVHSILQTSAPTLSFEVDCATPQLAISDRRQMYSQHRTSPLCGPPRHDMPIFDELRSTGQPRTGCDSSSMSTPRDEAASQIISSLPRARTTVRIAVLDPYPLRQHNATTYAFDYHVMYRPVSAVRCVLCHYIITETRCRGGLLHSSTVSPVSA